MLGLDLASTSSELSEPTLLPAFGEERCRVVALDYGVKGSIYRELRSRGASVLAMPGSTSPDDILAADPDGLFLSNGPGDPAALGEVVDTLRPLLGEIPTFGICLGHQLLGLALGCETYKMPFGHHGANHPVRNLKTGSHRDNEPEPRVRRQRGLSLGRRRVDPPQPLRRHGRGHSEPRAPGLERSVPSRIQPRSQGLSIPLRGLRRRSIR